MDRVTLTHWLREDPPAAPAQLEELWRLADLTRSEHVGDAVHLRGLIEISNHCSRRCAYCGLRAPNGRVRRYRMTADEILDCARLAVGFGYGTIVLQGGEDDALTGEWIAEVIRLIRSDPHTAKLAVTLSLGERNEEDLALWKAAGADRYLLRFETSNRQLFDSIHPPRDGETSDRFAILDTLRRLGYETGSGVMVGLPGQTIEDLADDIEMFAKLDLDMIGLGPFLPHPDTPMSTMPPAPRDQVPNSAEMTYKVLALARIACPAANIPSTTALGALCDGGHEAALRRGTNVIMPNLTPATYRDCYEIYPAKARSREAAEQYDAEIHRQIAAVNRTVGRGRGDSAVHRVLSR